MPDDSPDFLLSQPRATNVAVELLYLAAHHDGEPDFLADALEKIAAETGAGYAAAALLGGGAVNLLGQAGTARKIPSDLVAEAVDRERALVRDDWCAVPLPMPTPSGEVLVAFGADSAKTLEAMAAALARALQSVRRSDQQRRRIERLETILEIAQQWNRTNQMEPLLVQMAEAATRLLEADRASIFLWDRPNRRLIARPALGVPGGELTIADNVGVAGAVLRSGMPRRVDAGLNQEEIDQQVGADLGYATRTLLCVPLVGGSGQPMGAFEVLNKREGNFTAEDEAALTELARHAAVALENTQQLESLVKTHTQLVDQAAEGVQLIGASPAIEALRSTVRRVADTELAILILGENGTGKEVVSQAIHYLSRRRDQPFIAINCAALTETLLESELFGHERGAFTDAHESRQGKFELASGGTLFLDEIGDLSLGGQAKLLRVLEEKVVVRVGGSTPIHTDARVLAATNQNLAEMVRTRRFREDLYYRLNVLTLELPPLRERGDDIVLLAEHFLVQFSRNTRRKVPKLAPAARKRLLGHAWPGNVRELRNLMERLAYLLPGDRIEAEDLAFVLAPVAEGPGLVESGLPLTEASRLFQTEYIQNAIDRAAGNMSEAAEQLGLHRSNLYRKMRQLNMPIRE